MRKWVRIKVPASTSNLGPGFDVLGLALKLYNEIEMEARRAKGGGRRLEIEIEGEGENSLPRDERNVVWKAASHVFKKARVPLSPYTFHLRCLNRIPLARGLGSSAAAALGGALAGNVLAGNPLSQNDLLDLAVRMEGHPDNVAPALLGGLCISALDGAGTRVIKLVPPRQLSAVVCVPDFELSTKKARAALAKKIEHRDGVFNVSRVALFLGALFSRRFEVLKLAMEDRLHQPYRKKLIPGFEQVLSYGYRAGAWGVALSGAGPSMFALAKKSRSARVGRQMEKGFARAGVKAKSMVLDFNLKGPEISWR